MVERCLNNSVKECVIVDFDNTFITKNSTVEIAIYLAKLLLKKSDFKNLMILGGLILRRKLRLISHKELKHFILTQANKKFSEKDWNDFISDLRIHTDQQIKRIIKIFEARGLKILIATAAGDLIISRFSEDSDLTFDYVASEFKEDINQYFENSGKEKLESVKRYLKENSLNCRVVISDNEDDIPLFQFNNKGINYILRRNGKKSELEEFKNLRK